MKKVFSILVLLVISVFPLSVFADDVESNNNKADNPTTFTLWDYDTYYYSFGVTTEYKPVSSLYIEGKEYYDESSEEWYDSSVIGRHYFDITADEEGYYAVMFSDPQHVVSASRIQKDTDDTSEGVFKNTETILDDSGYECGIVFEMRQNESEYIFIDEGETGSYSIKYVYLGDSITSVNSAGPLVYGFDSYKAEAYTDDGKSVDVMEMYPHIDVTFSDGMTVKLMSFAQCTELGEKERVTVQVNVLDEKYDIDIVYIRPENLVSDVYLPDGFVPSCRVSYDGSLSDYIYPDYAVAVLNDGKKINIKRNDNVVLPNGRGYDFCIEYNTDEEGMLSKNAYFTYSLNGFFESKTAFVPDCESVSLTLKKVISESKSEMKFGKSILKGKAGDWTKQDGIYFLFSFPRQMINAIRYYFLFGEYLNGLTVMLIFAVPPVIIIVIAVAIIILNKKKHNKV